MGKGISKSVAGHELEPVSLSELIHRQVRVAIETAVHEELRTALGAGPYERSDARRGYRNGTKTRTLTGPTGLVALTVPRATRFRGAGAKEWTSAIVPRYQRRMPEVNEAVIATYLAGGNTRRIRGALQPLLKAAPLSKSAVSHVVATLKDGVEAWRTPSLSVRCGPERQSSAVASTSYVTLSGRAPSMPSRRSAMTFIVWRTPPVPTRHGARTCVSSAYGPNVALASWPVFERRR
jgi:Transposase, Mutator family